MILYAGQRMEHGGRGSFHQHPRHPYSDLLIASVPELRQGWLDSISETGLKEASATIAREAAGHTCSFFERCAVRIPGRCDVERTPVRSLSKGAEIRCQRTERDLIELITR